MYFRTIIKIQVVTLLLLVIIGIALTRAEVKLLVLPQYGNVRKGPSIEEEKVGYVEKGDLLAILERSGKWFKVSLKDGKEGWVLNTVVKEIEADIQEQNLEVKEGDSELLVEEKKTEINNDSPQESAKPVINKEQIVEEPEKKEVVKSPAKQSKKVKKSASSSASRKNNKNRYLLVTRDEVNIRKGPGTDYTKLHCVNSNDRLDYEELEGNWYKVRYKDLIGWIRKDMVKEQEDKKETKDTVDIDSFDTLELRKDLLTIVEKLLKFYNQSKWDNDMFKEAKWFPSFDLLDGIDNIKIDGSGEEDLHASIDIYVRKISLQTFLPIRDETFLYLEQADKTFLQMLMKDIMGQKNFNNLKVNMWFLRRVGEDFKWKNLGCVNFNRTVFNKTMDSTQFWDMLENNLDNDVWFINKKADR